MQVLVVGAGAVGQVYGRHLQLGGARVTFFVKEKYREESKAGFTMYPLNRAKKKQGEPVRFTDFDVVTTAAEVAARKFDQVWLTVSSTQLAGPWLPQLIAAIGDATLVSLQPGVDSRDEILSAGAAEDRLVSGLISLISYHAPLPGETRFAEPGMAYWFPPGGPSPFSGPRAKDVVDALKAGKQPAKLHKDVPAAAGFPNAVMMPYLVALEAAGWSFDKLLRDEPQLALGARGAREALAVVSTTRGKAPLGVRLMTRPRALKIGLWFGKKIVPLPLEPYLEKHFTKVGDQTRMFIQRYIEVGKESSVDVSALEQLAASIPVASRAA